MNTINPPIVSIIMPAYNAQRFLHEAIESILCQSFQDFEFLIMDDGSTDSTWQILQDYAQKDARIKLFKQENKGVAVSLNYLLNAAQGEFIARMDADDISHPDRLQQQVDYLMQHPKVGLLSTAQKTIAPNGLSFRLGCPPDNQVLLEDLFSQGVNPITHGSVMMRKSILLSLNEPAYKLNRNQDFEDFDLWKRLIKVTKFSVIKNPLYSLRQYSGSLINRWENNTSNSETTIFSNLDHKVSLLLKKKLTKDQGYEYFLNARAFFLNGHYLLALLNFIKIFFCNNREYKIKSFFLIGLVVLGPLGIFIYRKMKNKPNSYYQY